MGIVINWHWLGIASGTPAWQRAGLRSIHPSSRAGCMNKLRHGWPMTWRKRALAAVALLGLAPAAVAADGGKPVLAVLKFQDETGVMPLQGGVGRVLTNMLGTELAARDVFTVVERRKLAAILEEQDLAQSGRLKPGEGAKIGQLTGAQY